jgi:hypothetical protein
VLLEDQQRSHHDFNVHLPMFPIRCVAKLGIAVLWKAALLALSGLVVDILLSTPPDQIRSELTYLSYSYACSRVSSWSFIISSRLVGYYFLLRTEYELRNSTSSSSDEMPVGEVEWVVYTQFPL